MRPKKILLTAINAKYIHSNLAVYSLRAYAQQQVQGVQIDLAEYTINHRTDYILQEIFKYRPDVLCFSVYIWNLTYVEEISLEFHKLCPRVPIWVGGPEVSYETEDFLREHPYIAGVMIGEGEETFSELCGYYAQKHDCAHGLEEIAGIAYIDSEDGIRVTSPRALLDMSAIPFCYQDMSDFANRIVYYESSRGCPFSCSYCLSSVEKSLRFRDLELVKRELLFFIEQKVRQVKFVDRTFNCDSRHARAIWRFIRDHDRGITNFHFEIAADLVTAEELELLRTFRPGLIQLEIGVQSTYDPTIREIRRVMSLDRVREMVEQIRSYGNIHQHLDLIAGLPYEDYETFGRSFDAVYAWKPEQLQLGFLKVLKGSFMYEHRQDYGLLYHTKPPYEVMRTNWLSYDDMLRIKLAEEMLEVYYNSGQFEVTIKLLELEFDSAFQMYESLGAYYEQCGYFRLRHTRIRRFEILLEFVRQVAPEYLEMYQEALTLDLYLRENLKSRPYWAPPASEFREMTRKWCPDGKMSHVEPFHFKFPDHNRKSIEQYPQKTDCFFVHFDYGRCDPLTNQAHITHINGNCKKGV